MKKILIISMILSLSLVSGTILAQQATAPTPTAATPAPKAPASGLTVSRMEIAGSVENREPVGIAATFPASQEKVYCYVELKDVPKDTTITFAWTFGQNETDKVTQQVKKSSRWRTWGNKSLAGRKGDWKVDLLDESGAVLKSATFKVE
jgi:hypothetical protein